MRKRSSRSNDDGSSAGKGNAAKSSTEEKAKAMNSKILAVMFEFHRDEKFDVTMADVAHQIGCHERTKSFCEQFRFLKNKKKYIGASKDGTKGFQLTQEGLGHAMTPEYKEMIKEQSIKPKTNQEHQDRIKKYFKRPKSIEMFDILVKYGSVFPEELGALVGVNRRAHCYFYSWQELRQKGLVEKEPGFQGKRKAKYRLTNKAFLNHKQDRVGEENIDREKLAKCVALGRAVIQCRTKDERKTSNTKVKNGTKDSEHVKVKEEVTKQEDMAKKGAADNEANEDLKDGERNEGIKNETNAIEQETNTGKSDDEESYFEFPMAL
eukprot:jgi/Psemu1/3359/gm1.3359_g